MPSGKYYCDYCEKEFQDTQVARKRHLQSNPHLRAKALWYSSATTSGTLSLIGFCFLCGWVFNIFLCSSLKMLKSPALRRGVSATVSFHRYVLQSIYCFRRSKCKVFFFRWFYTWIRDFYLNKFTLFSPLFVGFVLIWLRLYVVYHLCVPVVLYWNQFDYCVLLMGSVLQNFCPFGYSCRYLHPNNIPGNTGLAQSFKTSVSITCNYRFCFVLLLRNSITFWIHYQMQDTPIIIAIHNFLLACLTNTSKEVV